VLIGRSLFSVVHEIARDAGPDDRLWERLLAAGAVAEEVPIEDTAPVDIDSPAHLRRARARMRKR
jgi:CTP:molybdopterin cytidylyltransferase MocA